MLVTGHQSPWGECFTGGLGAERRTGRGLALAVLLLKLVGVTLGIAAVLT